VRISHFSNFKAENVAWLYSHSEVCDDNIIHQPLHGKEPVRKPLQSSNRPVLVNAFEQLSITGVPSKIYASGWVKQRKETFVILIIVHHQDTPEYRVEG
jgi:hypothetical protein